MVQSREEIQEGETMFSLFSMFSRQKQYCESLKQLPQQLVRDLPMTPEIERALEIVGKHDPRLPRRLMLRAEQDIKLQFYYGGHYIAVTRTPEGLSVLAESLEHASELLPTLTEAERRFVTVMRPAEWAVDSETGEEIYEA